MTNFCHFNIKVHFLFCLVYFLCLLLFCFAFDKVYSKHWFPCQLQVYISEQQMPFQLSKMHVGLIRFARAWISRVAFRWPRFPSLAYIMVRFPKSCLFVCFITVLKRCFGIIILKIDYCIQGSIHLRGIAPLDLILKTLCIFSKKKATLDKVSNGSD